MPHKTLLIGVGTSGAQIVSEVIDRVVARFGSMDAAPWLQVVAFDTDRIRGLSLAKKDWVHVGLPEQSFRTFVHNPASLSSIEFERWSDRQVFQGNAASDHGASNVRMIGRASILHPNVFVKIHDAVKARLNRLQQLNLAVAAQAAGLPQAEVGGDGIRIFVCGTLTGGTCSGAFIDLGYYLRAYARSIGIGVQSYGVFGMPHPQGGSVRHRANAYQALRELNHYLTDGSHYRQSLPLPAVFPAPIEYYATAPYQSSLLLMPAGATPADFKGTYTAAAEYLYTAACTSMADEVYSKIVDPAGSLFGVKSRGRHMNFQSLGAATLEFPADHIGKGGAASVIASALGEWLASPGIDPGAAAVLLNAAETQLTREDMRQQLLNRESGQENIEDAVDARLKSAQTAAARGDLGAIKTAKDQIEEGFAARTQINGGIGPRAVLEAIEKNKKTTTGTVLSRLQKRMDQALLTMEEGPNWCRTFADAILIRIGEMREQSTSQAEHEREGDRGRTMREKEAMLDEVNNSKLLGGLGFKGMALAKLAEDWYHAARQYYTVRIDDACGIVESDQLAEIREFAQRVKARLDGHEMALVPLTQSIGSLAAAEAARRTGERPNVRGVALFEPGLTVPAELTEAMRRVVPERDIRIRPNRVGLAYAMARTIIDWPLLNGALSAEHNKSPFDGRTTALQDEQTADEQKAALTLEFINRVKKAYFMHLWERNALVELFGEQNNQAAGAVPALLQVAEQAAALIQENDNESPLGPIQGQDLRTPRFAFIFNGKAEVFPYVQTREALQDLIDPANNIVPTQDPTKLLILQGRTTFAAGDIVGIDAFAAFHAQAEGMNQGRLESRTDVVWRTLDGQPLHHDLDESMSLFLFGLATGVIQNHHAVDEPYFLSIPGQTPIRLPEEIEMAGYKIATFDNGIYRIYLRQQFGQAANAVNRAKLLIELDRMIRQHTVLYTSLRYRYVPVQAGNQAVQLIPRNFVRDALVKLIRTNQDAFRDYCVTYITDYHQTPEEYFRAAGAAGLDFNGQQKPAGYYCPTDSCKRLLRPAGNQLPLPETCPNCGYSLLMPGYYEIAALRGAAVAAPAVVPNAGPVVAPEGNFG